MSKGWFEVCGWGVSEGGCRGITVAVFAFRRGFKNVVEKGRHFKPKVADVAVVLLALVAIVRAKGAPPTDSYVTDRKQVAEAVNAVLIEGWADRIKKYTTEPNRKLVEACWGDQDERLSLWRVMYRP